MICKNNYFWVSIYNFFGWAILKNATIALVQFSLNVKNFNLKMQNFAFKLKIPLIFFLKTIFQSKGFYIINCNFIVLVK